MVRQEVESRNDILAWTSDVLTEPVSACGTIEVHLFVESDREDTDFVVRLCDVYPDGRSMLVTDGAHRMRFRNSLSKAEWMEPGTVYPVTIELSVTALTFQKGHQIRVLVSSSNTPRFDVNPNNGETFLSTNVLPLKATNTVYYSPTYSSQILFPIRTE